MKDPFKKAKVILQQLQNHGFDAYFVGGSVRDFLLGSPIHDIDIATSATPDQVIAIFPKTFPIGIQHGTVLVRHENESYEITTFRSESGYGDFRHPDQVAFETSIEKDLARRDFTINAMAMDSDGLIIDPYKGQLDLKNRCLKTVGEAEVRFKEDPLRILRAVRFVAQLNLIPEQDLQIAMKNVGPYIQYLAIERIREEFTKLLAGKWLDNGIHLLIQTELIKAIPVLSDGWMDLDLDRLAFAPFAGLQSDAERWALFLILTNYKDPEKFLKSWRFSNKEYNKITVLLNTYINQRSRKWDRYTLYQCGIEVAKSVERMKKALNLSSVDSREMDNLWEVLSIKSRSELAVNGSDVCHWLNQQPGPWTGELLAKIEMAVVQGELKNNREAIREWVQRVN